MRRYWFKVKHKIKNSLISHRLKRLSRSYHFPDGYKRIYHLHIQKTGGTSLNQMFLSLGGENGRDVYSTLTKPPHYQINSDKVFVAWDKRLVESGNYFYAHSHIPAHQLNLPENTFTFTCLRDPFKRVISDYKMFVEAKYSTSPPPWYAGKVAHWVSGNFDDFLRRVDKERLLAQLYMFSATYDADEAYDRIVSCSHWFLTENFVEGVAGLSAKLDLVLTPLHVRKTSVAVQMTNAQKERLWEMLEPEYQLYHRLKA